MVVIAILFLLIALINLIGIWVTNPKFDNIWSYGQVSLALSIIACIMISGMVPFDPALWLVGACALAFFPLFERKSKR